MAGLVGLVVRKIDDKTKKRKRKLVSMNNLVAMRGKEEKMTKRETANLAQFG